MWSPAAGQGEYMAYTSRLRRCLFVSGVIATLALAGTAPGVAAQGAVPFVAALSGTAQWDGGPVAMCQSSGVASHLGLTTSQCSAVLDFANYRPYAECSGEGTGFGLPNVNTMVLTAADGDQLVLVSIDLACELVPFTSFHGTGQWTVDSSASTGRFAGATGSGTLDGNVDFFAQTVDVGLVGEITY